MQAGGGPGRAVCSCWAISNISERKDVKRGNMGVCRQSIPDNQFFFHSNSLNLGLLLWSIGEKVTLEPTSSGWDERST